MVVTESMMKYAIMLGVFLAVLICDCEASDEAVFSNNFAMPPINVVGIMPCAIAWYDNTQIIGLVVRSPMTC